MSIFFIPNDDILQFEYDPAKEVWEGLVEGRVDTKRVNVDFPVWMVNALDREARRIGVGRQAVIKTWIAERLDAEARRSA